MRWIWIAAVIALLPLLSHVATATAPVLRAGAAAVKITPSLERRVWIAGYGMNRPASSVHDDLWARALVLEMDGERLAIVAVDLIGLLHHRVEQVRARVTALPGERVVIAATHTHSGPDTIGLWGPEPATPGRDPVYMDALVGQIAAAVDQAARDLRPTTIRVGSAQVPDGFLYNAREEIQEKLLTAVRFQAADASAIATLINYGGHPEVMRTESRALSSDWVHYARETVERAGGGTAIFLNGALGGMVTPAITDSTWDECQRVGEGVGRAAQRALEQPELVEAPAIRFWRRAVTLDVENAEFLAAARAGILERGSLADGRTRTEVCRIDLGPIRMLTLPGEVLPRPWLELKREIDAPFPICVALGNDELGYILTPDEYDRDLYRYERSRSVGREAWPRLRDAARALLAKP